MFCTASNTVCDFQVREDACVPCGGLGQRCCAGAFCKTGTCQGGALAGTCR
jgi:hypothetical protein